MLTDAERAFYLRPSSASDPGALPELDGLPADPGELAGLVRGLVLHRAEVSWRFEVELPDGRLDAEPDTRYAADILRLVLARNPSPLTEPRPLADRFVGTCRDFSLLHSALLRRAGVPARIRCGFATYFIEGFHEDHWVTEYWDDERGWTLADAQLFSDPVAARTEKEGYAVSFDPLRVPRDRFLVAGDAWRACRTGRRDPQTFGVSHLPALRGLPEVLANLLKDLAALNRVEVLPWDGWGLAEAVPELMGAADYALLDAAARATSSGEFAGLRELYLAHEGLRPARMIVSHTAHAGDVQVLLRADAQP
ncbi:transglutaminase-like domain-containing protein [Streptomyces sp. NPDC051940]|uniref:transglutaminase-like domain-containing protein n=1 Tax=Streptomyces sp. NPDC051940 TaxID=3155675 RepID=UPI0034185BB6